MLGAINFVVELLLLIILFSHSGPHHTVTLPLDVCSIASPNHSPRSSEHLSPIRNSLARHSQHDVDSGTQALEDRTERGSQSYRHLLSCKRLISA